MAEAQRAVAEDLRLDAGVLGDKLDLLQAQLPGQHRPGQPHLRRGFHAGEVMDAHLGAGVKRNVRQSGADGLDEAQILDDNAVGAQVGSQLCRGDGRLQLPVVHQGVQGHIDLAAPDAAIAHGFFKFFVGKILGAAAGVEIPHSQIHGVRPVLDGGDDRFRRTRRREKLDHISISLGVCAPMGIISL